MLSVAVTKPNKVKVVDIPKPMPGPYQVRICTELACLCNSTDRKLVTGHFPGLEKYPLLLGHESVGIVDAVGGKVRSFKEGDRVVGGLLLQPTDSKYASGWGGFSEYTLAGDHPAMVQDGIASEEYGWFEVFEIQRVVPKSISADAAVLLCTWREVYAGFDDFRLQKGDEIVIFGAGPVGLSFLKFGRLLRLNFIGVVDPLESKRNKAAEMGADVVLPPDDKELRSLLKKRDKPFDAVIDAVGSEPIINTAIMMIKKAGSICVYGVIDKPEIRVKKSLGPYNFNLYIHQWPTRFREAAAQEPLCEWLQQGKIKSSEFITARFPVSDVEDAIRLASSGEALKVLLGFG